MTKEIGDVCVFESECFSPNRIKNESLEQGMAVPGVYNGAIIITSFFKGHCNSITCQNCVLYQEKIKYKK